MTTKTKGNRERKHPTSKEINGSYDVEPIFQRTLQLVEAAVSGGLIGGVTLTSFSIALSYQTLNCAAIRKQRFQAIFDQWTSDPKLVWHPIVEMALAVIRQCPMPKDEAAFMDLCFLRDECQLRIEEVGETDAYNDSKRAMQIIETIYSLIHQVPGLPAIVVEMAFLVVWFKVAALSGDVSDEDYLGMREVVPLVFDEYEKILNKSHLSPV